MAKTKSQEREQRIQMEIVVDANGPEEVAMGWYYYLDEVIQFPFTATCNGQRATSPFEQGDEIEVTALADLDECMHEVFVMTRLDTKRQLAIPLAQLTPISTTDLATKQAVGDWHYWVKQGYEF